MNELLTPEKVSEQLAGLGSYAPWQETVVEESALVGELPKQFNKDSRNHLEAQIRVVDAGSQEVAARQELVVDVAKQDDEFLPVVYRLGVVAVFDRLKTFKNDSHDIFSGLQKEDQIRPSANPLIRATQIAEELLSIMTELEAPTPIPVAMVENEYCQSCREEYTLIASGKIVNPEMSLKIEAPKIIVEDGELKVVYAVPTVLQGVTEPKSYAGHEAVGFYRSEPERYSVGKTEKGVINPPIPRLIKLVGREESFSSYLDALYLGDRARSKIKSAESYEAFLMRPRKASAGSSSLRYRRIRRY